MAVSKKIPDVAEAVRTSLDAPPRWRRVSLEGLRASTLVVVLLGVWIAFQILSDGLFLSSRNLSNLGVQFAITAILAVGIVVVMVSAEIDLSAGAAVGLCGIMTAVSMTHFGLPVEAAIAITLGLGLLIGLWHGVWVAVAGVPAFIVTLASLLGLRGVALVMTDGRTFIPGPELSFLANDFLPLWVLIAMAVLLMIGVSALAERDRRIRREVGASAPWVRSVGLPVLLAGVAVGLGAAVFASYRGLPLPVAILLVVAVVVALVLRRTVAGRHLFAVGGDRESTRRSGVSLTRVRMWPFIMMGGLYGLAGLIFVSRLGSAPAQGAFGLELNVIAAAVLGGTSLFGGVGTVGGAILGALLMESLSNGMVLLDVESYYQQVVVGLMLLIAVFIDTRARRAQR